MQALDVHVHVPRQPGLPITEIDAQLGRFFGTEPEQVTVEALAETYERLDVVGVLFSVDTETVTGDVPDSNDYVASIVESYPDRFIGFATVDPWKGQAAVSEVERSARDLGLRGLKLHPVHQAFRPNDRRFYPLYDKCAELEWPVLVHSGYAAAGAGLPGGAGLKLKHSAPIPYVDDVAADFPELTIIMAHPGWPWLEQQIAVALHKPNVFIDLSGWAPKYVPEVLVREAGTRLRNKVLFGSDFPFVKPDRWLREFADWKISEETRPKILHENARRILGI